MKYVANPERVDSIVSKEKIWYPVSKRLSATDAMRYAIAFFGDSDVPVHIDDNGTVWAYNYHYKAN